MAPFIASNSVRNLVFYKVFKLILHNHNKTVHTLINNIILLLNSKILFEQYEIGITYISQRYYDL